MSQLSSSNGTQDVSENSMCESEEDYENANNRTASTSELIVGCNYDNNAGSTVKRKNKLKAMTPTKTPGQYVQGHTESPVVLSDPLSASTPTTISTFAEERMKRKLQFFFMNPIEKWQTRRRFPFKFLIQLIKIVIVSMQLCLFAHSRYNHVNYTWDNRVSFSHMFLRGWDATYEVEAYPPAIGPLALYIQDDFYETIDYAINGYQNISIAIGPYSYPTPDNTMPPLKLCLYQYKQGIIFGFNESYIFNPKIDKICLNLTGNVSTMGSKEYISSKDLEINFAALVKATLEFSMKTVNFKAAGPIAPPDCYQFDVKILFDNTDHDGQMLLSLDAEPIRLHCQGDVEYITTSEIDAALRTLLNSFVIIICLLSFILCTRALYRAWLLRNQTIEFFRSTYGTELSWDGRMEFINFWYIMIIINDLLLILGSSLKEQIERSNFTADEWNTCSVMLGIGNLLVWFGVLRYLGFFKTYNVVILTIKRAAPKISRFLLCALLIYAGFTFCGWLVLGPYHIKFRSLSVTSECLFALINGDELYATFATMSSKSQMLWWFSRIYLYSFISLYIYVVLSLFISVIMDAYDTIKKYYKDGFPINDLRTFMGPINLAEYSSGVFDEENESDSLADVIKNFCRCGRKQETEGPTGYTSLHPKGTTGTV